VEDLYRLVERAAGETGAMGVSAGAILSDYQRVRVESVCSRLGLTSLAFLWRRDQVILTETRDGILEPLFDKRHESFVPCCYSQSLLLADFTPFCGFFNKKIRKNKKTRVNSSLLMNNIL
jgi:hypothetical protein